MDVRTLNKIIQKFLKKFALEWWTEVASRQPASERMKKYSLTLYADMLERQTGFAQNEMPQGVGIQVPLSAPRRWHFSVAAILINV